MDTSQPKSNTTLDQRPVNERNLRALVVEDFETMRRNVVSTLETLNMKIIEAVNGLDALRVLDENKDIDLVLMDILMPEMDGYEASNHVKALRPNLPILAQTAYSLEGDKDREEIKNFSEYLIKPIWSPQLMAAVDKYFR